MRILRLILMLLALALALAGCRFVVVETGAVRVEAPTAVPGDGLD